MMAMRFSNRRTLTENGMRAAEEWDKFSDLMIAVTANAQTGAKEGRVMQTVGMRSVQPDHQNDIVECMRSTILVKSACNST